MLFNSWAFFAFLLPVTIVYYAQGSSQSGQYWLALVASLFFYGYGDPGLVVLLVFSLAFNTAICRQLSVTTGRATQAYLVLGVGLNLLLLAFFKYAGLIAHAVLPEILIATLPFDPETIPLPIGISFYTFQAISLLVDLGNGTDRRLEPLRGKFKVGEYTGAMLRIAFYISFFPQLVAGPIVKAGDFLSQIRRKYFADVDLYFVLRTLVAGFFLKMVVADNLKDVTQLLDSADLVTFGKIDLIALLYGYSFQIFADFAGYSLIAIGLGALFGYRFPINFNNPYISMSITEFWQRWHISLSSFLKQYLYVPLGGNRHGRRRTYLNLAIVMVLGGLWHGAAWSFAIWGAAHGVFLAIERLWRDRRGNAVANRNSPGWGIVRILWTFHVVSALWLLFLLPDFSRVIEYTRAVISAPMQITSLQSVYVVALFSLPVILMHVHAWFSEQRHMARQNQGFYRMVQAPLTGLQLFLIMTNSGSSGAFIYFQF